MTSLTLRISVTVCIILVVAHQITSLPRPQQRSDDAALAEAIDYLHALESAYSQSGRPRFGKRDGTGHGKAYKDPNQNDDEEDWAEYRFVRR